MRYANRPELTVHHATPFSGGRHGRLENAVAREDNPTDTGDAYIHIHIYCTFTFTNLEVLVMLREYEVHIIWEW